ncbi:TnsA endonuclease N-terminal domain-containing protein [Scytonema hofmannii]|nr:TnsA endonuclease N-terminal domain-containing protein [Scytonema hofmannii]
MNTVVWWESQIERDYIYLLEIDPEVVSYQEQPLTITYTMEGKVRKYTPDFLVNQLQKTLLVEVKPDEKAHSKKNFHLFRHIAPIAKTHNMEFVVVTEKMIRVQPKLNNIKLLYKYARVTLSLSNYLNVREYFHANQSVLMKDAQLSLKAKGITVNMLLRLLWSGCLVTDMMQPINGESLIQMLANDCNWERLINQ